jgi:hypothetical protein
MKTEAETIMDGLCVFLNESILEMLILVEMEEYETAAATRDDIQNKIEQVKKALVNNKWTKLDEEQIHSELASLRDAYTKKWEDEIPFPWMKSEERP